MGMYKHIVSRRKIQKKSLKTAKKILSWMKILRKTFHSSRNPHRIFRITIFLFCAALSLCHPCCQCKRNILIKHSLPLLLPHPRHVFYIVPVNAFVSSFPSSFPRSLLISPSPPASSWSSLFVVPLSELLCSCSKHLLYYYNVFDERSRRLAPASSFKYIYRYERNVHLIWVYVGSQQTRNLILISVPVYIL